MNSEVLNKGELLIPQGTKQYANDLRKHGVEPVEIPYSEIWGFMGSGIHCSSAAIWRE
jgi:N-dimethylarginine dimethylaminohydrolase